MNYRFDRIGLVQRFGALRSGGISKPKRSAKIQISIEVQNLNFALQPA